MNPDTQIDFSQKIGKYRYKEYYLDSTIGFGKFEGKEIQELITEDPDYLRWCILNLNHFILDEEILSQLNFQNENERINVNARNYLKLLYKVQRLNWEQERICSGRHYRNYEQFSNEDAFDSPEQYGDFLASR